MINRSDLHIFYRISNNSYKKKRLDYATKQTCLSNFIETFGTENLTIIADNVTEDSLRDFLSSLNVKIINTSLGNAQSCRYVMDLAALSLKQEDYVYFVEDDYLHKPSSQEKLLEGLEVSHYVTLYDHPDKYWDRDKGGPNPFIQHGGEESRVLLTKSTHWKETNSTTMTFATRVVTLIRDLGVWFVYLKGDHPYDFQAFCDLKSFGRRLISPIPGCSTHTEVDYLSPFF